ncbi:PAS domain S-box protein [Desulfospira joergensenii]|uniref:PAS domain S-box protein n=1 Tax=Desulfospira joergensenii TaxID=53329 RepID=UPI0003B63F6D|nr:PAS domain S-box protein [Desulfospira joergensenii]
MRSPIPLKGYLSLHFGLVAALPVIIIACLVWFVMVPGLEERTEIQNQAMALSMADQVSAYLGVGKSQMAALAQYLQNRPIQPDTVSLLDAHCGDGEFFEALFVMDNLDETIQVVGLAKTLRPNRADFVGLDLSGRRFTENIKDLKGAVWSKTILSTVTSRMAVALALPLNGGFLIGEITLDKLSEFIRDLPVESEFRTMVIDGQGIIVADSQKRHWGERLNVNFPTPAGPENSNPVTSTVFELDGEQMLGSLVNMDAVRWKILTARPVRKAFQPVWDTFVLIGLGLVIGLGLAMSISWLLSGKLARVFSTYALRAKSIADGDYELQWPAAKTREFFQLGQNLQLMAEKIRQREKALIDGEHRLRDLLANVPGVVYQFTADPENPESYSSASVLREKALEILGLDSEEKTYFNDFIACLPREDQPRFVSSVKEAVEKFKTWYYQGRFIKPSGQEIWVEGNSSPRRIDNKIVFYGLITDITRRKEMESSLHLAQFCFDNAAVGIHHIGDGGRILNVNEYAAKMLGYTTDELSGLSVLDIDPFAEIELLEAGWERLISEGKDLFETTHKRKDGSLVPVEITSTLLEYEGRQFSICFVQDITERKQMEKALKESQERLDLALAGANEGIWDWHMTEDTVYFDDRYYTMAGYEPNEFPGTFHEFEKRIHPEDLERVKSLIDRYLAGDTEIYEMEFRFLRKDKEFMWIQAKGKIVDRDDQGNPARFVGTHADITVRKRAEEALRENEQLLANILESMDEGVLVLDHEFKYQIVNRKLEQLGASRERIIGKTPWEAFPYIKNTAVEERMRKAMKGHVMSSSEIKLHISDNQSVWSRDSFSPLRDANGRVIGVVGMINDITRHKQDEEELRQLRSYLSNIIDSMPSILVAVDREGKVTQWNHRTEQVTGVSFEDARSQSLSKLFPRLSGEMERIRTAIRERRVISSSKVSRRLEKDVRYEDITIFPLKANGVEGAVIRVDDVTEKVRLEEMMIQSEKMLSVGGLAAGMAHEINNPLAGMLQTASVLSNRLNAAAKIPGNRKAAEAAGTTMAAIEAFMEARGIFRMLSAIDESGQQVSSIVNNMLSFARKSESKVLPHDLEDLIDKTLALAVTDYDLKKEYDFKLVDIVKEYGKLSFPIPCEAGKVQQVLLNIFRNGAQAMQAAGTQSPRFIIRTLLEADMARIEIEDNGPGMDEATRKRVFEPFFTTKPVGVGTGLGLSVSYFIITQNHGGKMKVESKPGQGTKFIILLPVNGAKE